MQGKRFSRTTATLTVAVLVGLVLPVAAFGWGAATHTYLAKELGNDCGLMDLNEMYGAVTPDMFNLLFGHPHRDYLWTETHYGFMKVVGEGTWGRKKAFAYGFASHNEAFGADHTAHLDSILYPGDGYVPTKVGILAPWLEPEIEAFLVANGIPHTPALVEELAEVFADTAIESAVDLLVSRKEDPTVGVEMFLAAGLRGPFVPFLLWEAYGGDYVAHTGTRPLIAALFFLATEKRFRENMMLYGLVLAQDDAVALMAEQGAELASAMLEGEYGIQADVPPALVEWALLAAVAVVEFDYSAELEATLEFVEDQLELHGIETSSW